MTSAAPCGHRRCPWQSVAERATGLVASYNQAVSATNPIVGKDLVVAADESIPADQVARLGLRPGAHLRVIETDPAVGEPSGLAGSLPDLPDLDRETFERGSTLARSDLSAT